MKRVSNWSLLGYILGTAFSIFSAIRYFLIYPDTDRALVYVGIGIMVCGLAFLYNRSVQQGRSIEAIENYISDKNFEEKEKNEREEKSQTVEETERLPESNPELL